MYLFAGDPRFGIFFWKFGNHQKKPMILVTFLKKH